MIYKKFIITPEPLSNLPSLPYNKLVPNNVVIF